MTAFIQPGELPSIPRRKINAMFAAMQALAPGYDNALPDASDQVDGRYFTRTSDQTLHQVQNGVWVQLT